MCLPAVSFLLPLQWYCRGHSSHHHPQQHSPPTPATRSSHLSCLYWGCVSTSLQKEHFLWAFPSFLQSQQFCRGQQLKLFKQTLSLAWGSSSDSVGRNISAEVLSFTRTAKFGGFLYLGGAPHSEYACFRWKAGEKTGKKKKKDICGIICGILDIKNSSIMHGAIAVLFTGSTAISKLPRFSNLVHLASQIKLF